MAITRIGNIASTIPDDSIQNAKFSNIVNFKNIIINGDFSQAQRGTSFTGLGNGDNGTYTLDRYFFGENSSPDGECTISQDTDVPTGQGFASSLKVDITTAETALANDEMFYIAQKIEGQNLQYLKYGTSNAESLTLSFWVKSNKTGTYAVSLYNQDPATQRVAGSTYTINASNTWEKKTMTFTGDTTGAFDNDNGASLWVNTIFASGSDYNVGTPDGNWSNYASTKFASGQDVNLFDNTANNFWITGVQLEAGTASDFEFLPVDVNLNRCHRYCNAFMDYGAGTAIGNRLYSSGYSAAGGFVRMSIPRMRTQPTLTYGIGGGTIDTDYGAPDIIQLYDGSDNAFYIYDVIAEDEL